MVPEVHPRWCDRRSARKPFVGDDPLVFLLKKGFLGRSCIAGGLGLAMTLSAFSLSLALILSKMST